ncbi:MAG: hypothetical protein K2P20_01870 [Oscillospiraceae bacterium]|nr:hypothetical protein [Oscillospiraceae bacterium]
MTVTIHIGKLRRPLRLTWEVRTIQDAIRLQSRARLSACRRELDRLRGTVACARCGASNAPRNLYCGSCGHPLGRP